MSVSPNGFADSVLLRAARRLGVGLPVVCVLALMLGACGDSAAPAAGGGAPGGGMPPPEVGVVTVTPGPVGLVTELPGRLEASRVAQVRARAAGLLDKRVFTEGSDVKAGQLLFRIDPAPYQAALASAQATLARAEATLMRARTQAERFKPLAAANAISQQDYLDAVTAHKQAEADVAAAKAAVQTAQINLGYAAVTSPIAGRIGRALVTEGALVGQGEATPLTVVQQIDPMYVNITQSTAEVLRLRKAVDSGQFKRAAATVQVLLEDGSEYARPGRLLFSDLTVDPTSGQITLRAEVPNPDGLLLPGMYVRVRVAQVQASDAILVPQQAVTRTGQGDTVLVVGDDNKPVSRTVTLGAAQNNQWVVLDGLTSGEKVIVEGFQKMMVPGAPVKPVAWQPPVPAAGASAPSAAASSAASAPSSR